MRRKDLLRPGALIALMMIWCSLNSQQEYRYNGSATDDIPEWAELMYSDSADAGQVTRLYETYFLSNEYIKNQHTQYYKRWLRSISREQSTDGRTPADRRYLNRYNQDRAHSRTTGDWQSIGPWDWDHEAVDKSYAPGAAHVYTIEQAGSDPDVLYAGTATAGLWKSTDRGLNWTNVTADLPMGGLTALEIDHSDPDVVYAEMMSSIHKTSNGGVTWLATGTESFQSISLNTADIVMHPDNPDIIWACTNKGLYSTDDAGATWTQEITGDFQELEFHPTDRDTIYAVRHVDDVTELHRSIDGGITFQQQSNGWPFPDTASGEHQRRTEIAVTPADPDLVVALATGSANGGSGLYGVYVSNDAGASWTFQCCGPQPAGPPSTTNMNLMGWSDQGTDDGGQYYYDLALDVSPTNADSIFVAGVNFWVSDDGGASFVCPAKWSHSSKPNYVHADIHDVHYYAATQELWVSGDGGIFYSDDNGDNFERRINGISGTDFWGFGSGSRDAQVMLGGTYHNGTLLKDDTVYANGWISTDGGDNYRGFVHPVLDRQAFSDYNIKTLSGDREVNNSTRGFQHKPNASYTIGKSSDLLFHPYYYGTWFTGSGTKLWRTNDNGYTFEELHDFGVDVASMDLCLRNPDAIYVTTFPDWWAAKRIWRTLDGGETWTDVTPTSTQLSGNLWVPFDIVVNAEDPLNVWIVRTSMYGGTNMNGAVLFESTDGGTSWVNITGDFPTDEAPACMIHLLGSDDALYVGTRRSVYRKASGSGSWQLWSSGLPAWTSSTKLVPDYWSNRIRNASNRSVWEREFDDEIGPMAVPSASARNLYCLEDTVYFKDNSIINASGASWEWTFQGGMPETSTERDPKVVYTEEGVFDVRLIVSDVNGVDTFNYPGMIKALNRCGVDRHPGDALVTYFSPDHVLVPDIDQTVDSFTVMAWIKPDGIQNDYSAILMNDGTAGGLNFREGNNTLGYHWPGGQWWWDSNLTAPPGVWSHVALVVTPTQVKVYLNGIEAVHNISTNPLELTTMRIGSYKGWAQRNYAGYIDEVSVFDKALTTDDIRSFRHLTLEGDEPGLIAYYQFNSEGSIVFDKAGSFDAVLNGNAEKLRSRAPAGGGTSQGMDVVGEGLFEFGQVGVNLNFGEGSISPGGPFWISRLDVDPDTLNVHENKLNRGYFIMNNYGPNPQFIPPFTIEFDSIGFVSDSMALNSAGRALGRETNSELTGWSDIAPEVDLSTGFHGSALTSGYSKYYPGQVLLTRDSFPEGFAEITISDESAAPLHGGQSVAVNVSSNNSGLALPVLDEAGLDSLGVPVAGMTVFYAPDKRLCFYDGAGWKVVEVEFIDIVPSDSTAPVKTFHIGALPAGGAILSLGTKGALLPNAFPDTAFTEVMYPAEGLLAFRIDGAELVIYNGEEWASVRTNGDTLTQSSASPPVVAGFATGTDPKEPAAAMQVSAGPKALRIPVLRCEEVHSPAMGTVIFDPTRKGLCLFNGSGWYKVKHH